MPSSHKTKIVEAAKEILKFHGYFIDNLWYTDDVYFICEQHDLPRLTNTEAMAVFGVANDEFDGETSISWPQLEKARRSYLNRREMLARMRLDPTPRKPPNSDFLPLPMTGAPTTSI